MERVDNKLQVVVKLTVYYFIPEELIRHVTINCTERGQLLLRIRDEIAMSMSAYETLYCSSVAFGMRKALQAQEGKERLQEMVNVLEVEDWLQPICIQSNLYYYHCYS